MEQLPLFGQYGPIARDADGVAHCVALSGGKDSTALALLMRARWPRLPLTFIYSPTGDELPEMAAHMDALEVELGQRFRRIGTATLSGLIDKFGGLPSHRMRWCTRLLKIEPALEFARSVGRAVQYVGLRADEPGRGGLTGAGDFAQRYPLREWGVGIEGVRGVLKAHGVRVPRRTDCARCYEQRIVEWKMLLEEHPDVYADACRQEDATGHTFRSPSRDTWPAGLRELQAEFEGGRPVRGEDMFRERAVCRACSL